MHFRANFKKHRSLRFARSSIKSSRIGSAAPAWMIKSQGFSLGLYANLFRLVFSVVSLVFTTHCGINYAFLKSLPWSRCLLMLLQKSTLGKVKCNVFNVKTLFLCLYYFEVSVALALSAARQLYCGRFQIGVPR